MRTAVIPDYPFDKKKFADVFSRAIGTRNQAEFAKEANLSRALVSKYLHCHVDKAPYTVTVKKIAAVAANNVSFDELMLAAGYDPKKYPHLRFAGGNSDSQRSINNIFYETIMNTLSNHNLSYSNVVYDNNALNNVSISYVDAPIKNWHFRFVDETSENAILSRLFTYYGKIATFYTDANTKISFVTDNESVYDQISQIHPYLISAFFSVVLIDSAQKKVLKESYLQSSNSDSSIAKQLSLL